MTVTRRWLPKDGKDLRTWLLFLGGLAGVANETFAAHAERPYLLVIFASMMGLPLFLRRDEPPDPPPGLPATPPLPVPPPATGPTTPNTQEGGPG